MIKFPVSLFWPWLVMMLLAALPLYAQTGNAQPFKILSFNIRYNTPAD